MRAAELLVKCLENEGVEYIFGIPGEENIDIMDALLESRHHVRDDASRTGRGLHGGRIRPSDRARGRVHGDARTGRDESHHRFRGREHGPRADRRNRRAGRDDAAPQGKPPDPRSGRALPAHHQIHRSDPRAGDRAGGRPESFQGRPDREARRLVHRLSREHRRDGSRREADQGADRLHGGCAGGKDRAGRADHFGREVSRSSSPATASSGRARPMRSSRSPRCCAFPSRTRSWRKA